MAGRLETCPTGHNTIVRAMEAAWIQVGLRRKVTLLIHPDNTIPMVWGIFRSRVLLPAAARHWSGEQLRSVLLHELAHIKRRDMIAQLVTHLACALYWFNPLVWFAAWRIGVERERACDDLVLASGVRPSAYARHLLEIVTGLAPVRWTQACGLTTARKSSLEGRLVAVLSEKLNRRGITTAVAVAALLLGVGIAVPLAILRAAEPDKPKAEATAVNVEPKDDKSRPLFEDWKTSARSDGEIPGGRIGEMAVWLKTFMDLNPTHDQSVRLETVLKKCDASRDWTPADAAALLDEIAAITPHAEWAMRANTERKIHSGKPLPDEFTNAPWGKPAANGLRIAWLLEPRAETYALDSVLKSRVLFHNTGKAPVCFATQDWIQVGHKAEDASGKDISVWAVRRLGTRLRMNFRLAPGEYAEVVGHGLGVGPHETSSEKSNFKVRCWIEAEEGDAVTFTPGIVLVSFQMWKNNEGRKDSVTVWQEMIADRVMQESPMPAAAADRALLLRRVTKDLLGTGPTAEEIAAFVADNAEDALARLIKRLQARAATWHFAGELSGGPTKFRVLPANPEAPNPTELPAGDERIDRDPTDLSEQSDPLNKATPEQVKRMSPFTGLDARADDRAGGGAIDTAKMPSGIFLSSDAADSLSFKAYHNEQVAKRRNLDPEPEVYRVDSNRVLDLGELGVAVSTTQMGGWEVKSRPNFVWEEDPNHLYGVFVYLPKEPSIRLAGAMRERNAQAVVVIDGTGWGKLEPLEVDAGKWGLRHVRTYFSPWMALKLNTHIVIHWQDAKLAEADEQLRKKLGDSVREWFTFRGPRNGLIDDAMGYAAFVRMGPPGWQMLTEAADAIGDQAVWCISGLALNLPAGSVTPVMSHVALHARTPNVQRAAMLEVQRNSLQYQGAQPVDPEFLVAMLDHADPMIAAIAFLGSSHERIDSDRTKIVELLKRYFAVEDHRVLGPGAKQDAITVNNINGHALRVVSRVIEKVGQAKLTEVATATTDAVIAARDQPQWASLAVHTLHQLGAVDELVRLVLERADLPRDAMEEALKILASGEDPANAQALIRISQAALAGKWDAADQARMQLVRRMVGFCRLDVRRVRNPRDDELGLAVRGELVKWVEQSERSIVLDALVWSPRAEEKAVYVAGLKYQRPGDAANCVRALGTIKASNEISALVEVLDRADTLEDLYAAARNNKLNAMGAPPIPQANLAYLVDQVLTEISGGKTGDVPAYTGPDVLRKRREHWRRWLDEHSI